MVGLEAWLVLHGIAVLLIIVGLFRILRLIMFHTPCSRHLVPEMMRWKIVNAGCFHLGITCMPSGKRKWIYYPLSHHRLLIYSLKSTDTDSVAPDVLLRASCNGEKCDCV